MTMELKLALAWGLVALLGCDAQDMSKLDAADAAGGAGPQIDRDGAPPAARQDASDEPVSQPDAAAPAPNDPAIDMHGADGGRDAGAVLSDAASALPIDASTADASVSPAPGTPTVVGVGNWGLRASAPRAQGWTHCGNPSTGNDHSPDLLRAVGYGQGVFIAVGGDGNGMVMRSVDGLHWEEDLHPVDACPDESFPQSCLNWTGAVAYGDGVWLAGGGNGAVMRSTDGGRSFVGVAANPRPSALRNLGFGGGRFVAGTDGGMLAVTSDAGDTWQLHDVGQSSLRIAFAQGMFIAWGAAWNGGGFDYACVFSADLGDNWQTCASEVAMANSFVHDGQRWVAANAGGYATSADGRRWVEHVYDAMPTDLLYDGEQFVGRRGASIVRGVTPDAFTEVATGVANFRGWTVGRVLDDNLPVVGLSACQDNR